MSAWESLFSQRITALRSAEVRSLAARKYLDALCVFFWAATPVLISLLTFLTYVLLGNRLTAAKVCVLFLYLVNVVTGCIGARRQEYFTLGALFILADVRSVLDYFWEV